MMSPLRCLLFALPLLAATPVAAQQADLLAIPDTLNRDRPAGTAGTAGAGAAAPFSDPAATPAPRADEVPNYRAEMRGIITELSAYARGRNPDFVVLARGGLGLLRKNEREAYWESLKPSDGAYVEPAGTVQRDFVRALDGLVLDNLRCRPAEERKALLGSVAPLTEQGRRLLSIDICADPATTGEALSFATTDAKLQSIPGRPPQENADSLISLTLAKNLLVMLRSAPHDTRSEWVMKLGDTNHDIIIIDALHRGSEALTHQDVYALKFKKLGSRRLVIAWLPLAPAMEDRFYWKKDWRPGKTSFLEAPVPDSFGAWRVRFWDSAWKKVIGQYMQALMDLGFDGVMLDGLEAYQAFEYDNPLTPDERKARIAAEKAAREKAELDKIAAEKAERDAAEKAAREKAEKAKPAADKPAADKPAAPAKPTPAAAPGQPDKAKPPKPEKPIPPQGEEVDPKQFPPTPPPPPKRG